MLAPKENLIDGIKNALTEANNPKRNFTQSVEIIVTFKGIDMKKSDIKFRDIIVLPKPPQKGKNVLVVPAFEQLEAVRKAEPNVILTKEELQKLAGQKRVIKKYARNNDWFLITPDAMSIAGRVLGPALGPRGKFPTPLPTNVDATEFVLRFKRSILLKTKDQPQIQTSIGMENQSPEDLAENAMAVLNAIEGKIRSPAYIKAIYFKTTMGKPIQVKLK